MVDRLKLSDLLLFEHDATENELALAFRRSDYICLQVSFLQSIAHRFKLDSGVHCLFRSGGTVWRRRLPSVTCVDTGNLWMRFRIMEGEGVPFVDRFLHDKDTFTAEQMKALFVNHNDGCELDLMDTDSIALAYTKVVGKKLKLKNSPLEGTSIDQVV